MASWFRWHHGTCRDAKLELLALEAEVSRPVAIAAWAAILEHASEANPRGSIGNLRHSQLAVTIGCTVPEAERILQRLTNVGLTTANDPQTLQGWEKRQFRSDSSTERWQKWQAKRKAEQGVSKHQRLTNVGPTAQNRTEQNRYIDSPLSPTETSPPSGVAGAVVPLPTKPVAKPSKAKPPAHYLPDDWSPTEAERAYALERGLTDDEVNRIALDFRDYWRDRRERRAGWTGTWQTWVRREADKQTRQAPRPTLARAGAGRGSLAAAGAYVLARRRSLDDDG